ncbi:Cro/CI family transcriptional regulator [Kingella oralis]|jgi:hypothetical protein|nr:MAG TPA: DNA-binding transcriptional regulator [Caudoviricetes sp.]
MHQEYFIQVFGGVSEVAKVCGITRSAVSQWKRNGIPKAQMNFLKTKFPRKFIEYQAIIEKETENG